MRVYMLRDNDDYGGHFAVYREVPVMSEERASVYEVRVGEFPDSVINRIDVGDIKPDPNTHFDQYIVPHWETAEVWWTREDGYVNA